MEQFLNKLPWSAAIFLCLTLGLAPFYPPHLFEKIIMLAKGQLKRPIDWFDLVLHGSPWILLILKVIFSRR
jgi:hypothetical protein